MTQQEQITRQNKKARKEQLKKKLFEIMRKHIGKENAINSQDLFTQIYGTNALNEDYYKVAFLWSLIKKGLHELRKENKLFVMQRSVLFFVLKSADELKSLKSSTDNIIKSLENYKIRAEKWVKNKEYENL